MEAGDVVAGKYRVLDRIGRGGMGAVYEVEHEITGKRLALKTLLPAIAGVPEIVKRFEREARALGVLAHPNIVAVTDVGELDDGALFLVLELARGRSLSDALEAETFGVARAGTIARQMLDALAHAHASGVIHRDLKPDNIMLCDHGASEDERDIVKLLDFGIAKLIGDEGELTQAGIAFGTPAYMAPEQALGEVVDARADLYAAGVILFEMLAGKPPFSGDDGGAVMRKQVAVDPPTLAKAAPDRMFTPALEAVVAKALAKRRGDRFADAGEMQAALDSALDERASADEASAVQVVEEVAAVTQRKRARIVVGLTIAGAIGLALAGVLLAEGGHARVGGGGAPIAVAAGLGDLDEALRQLETARTCAGRAAAIPTLRSLGDKSAIPALRRARNKRSGILDLSHPNGCLEDAANEAIDYLQKLP